MSDWTESPSRDGAVERLLHGLAAAHPGRVVLSVSFGGSGLVLAHMIGRLGLDIPVAFLDTGFHFAETYAFRNEFTARYGLRRIDVEPATEVGPLYRTDPDRCCHVRKVEPMSRVLRDFDVWVTALRRDQSAERGATAISETVVVDGRALRKHNPLADWTRGDVEDYVRRHRLPKHPLDRAGYRSIGCWPCTRPVETAAPERAGRWLGRQKTECGLHTAALGSMLPVLSGA